MVLEEGDHLDLAYREASRWLDGTTPWTAKRLANRLLFTTAVATERDLRGPIPPSTAASSASG